MSRLPGRGFIDRARPLRFRFNGRDYSGFAGDTLASALLANGVRTVARSFKYHRPRGVLSAGYEEPNALVRLRSGARAEPNCLATTVELFDGLEADSQNCWPGPRFDLMGITGLLSPVFVAGFYYKTFMWPAAFWEKLYEPLIRRAAGMGAISGEPDPDEYDTAHAFCDVLVVGAGPAGLAAALAAGRGGARVILTEQDHRPGGRLLSERHEVDGVPGADWAARAAAELAALPNVRILTRTAVFGLYDGGVRAALEKVSDHLLAPEPGRVRQRLWKIAAKRTVIAAGAVERPIVFGGNDRPGVMTASSVQTYLNRHGVAPGRRAVVFTATDSGWDAARDLVEAGVALAAIVDPRAESSGRTLGDVPVFPGGAVLRAHGAPLRAVTLRTADGKARRVTADLLAVSGGWNPSFNLATHLGQRPVWSDAIHAYVMQSPPPGVSLAGAAAGQFALADALSDGARMGARAAGDLGFDASAAAPRASQELAGVAAFWRAKDSRGKAFVDLQHDVTDKDIALAAREGFTGAEHMKRYTTLGMGADQGRTGQTTGNALLAETLNAPIQSVGAIVGRPPHVPVALGALAGRHRGAHFRPARLTPSHAWAAERGAAFGDAGLWKRARWFPGDGEDWLEAASREARAVRSAVGVCDVTTLGKIEVMGPDAGALLDRLYINTVSTLAIGRARYGVMLREDGFVLDDGAVARFAADRFFLTTTTANAARVMQHVDYCRQVLWPELDAQACSTTEHWAQFAVAGPDSRALLRRVLPDFDLSNAAFPYMSAAELNVLGAAGRLYRLSFSGELAYEVAVPAQHGDALWRALFEHGADLGVTPYGTEALSILRIEKGHAAGGELNGQTTAGDLGLGRMMSTKKDYIGRVLAGREGLTDPDRAVLVGLRPKQPRARILGGSHLLPAGAQAEAANDQGHVTSVAWSPELQSWIALALLKRGRERMGETIRAVDLLRGADVECEVVSPVFVDPEGARLHG